MKALLVAINAKYIHSNLGIYSIYAYCRDKGVTQEELRIREYTINQNMEDIIGNIYEEKPDLLGFSCYIWNIGLVKKIAHELRKILPECMIWYGGPEVSYDGEEVLRENRWTDGVMEGEGEKSFYEIFSCFQKKGRAGDYEKIKGLVLRKGEQIIKTGLRDSGTMDEVIFPYQDMQELENRIVYYETSRGCPYGCSYCLSSVEKQVKFRSIELVKRELQFFLDNKVPQVKFVDRTFNCNTAHTMEIWKYIKEHDNQVTNFHFELSADILTEEEISFVRQFRPGLAQFEIGVQTTNLCTLKAINRRTDLEKLQKNVAKIREGRNIHQHLDLIAGLPYEDMKSFHKSFNDVYAMKPDQLQVGFLKVLKGSPLHRRAEEFGIVYQSEPPYEVLYNHWISYEELRELKLVEEMVERYYNSMQFQAVISYLVERMGDAFLFYNMLGKHFKRKGYIERQQSRMQNYEILYEFIEENIVRFFGVTEPFSGDDRNRIQNSLTGESVISDREFIGEEENRKLLKELFIFDLYARENLKKEPTFLKKREWDTKQRAWLREFYQREETERKYLRSYQGYAWKQMLRMTHIEWFSYDILSYMESGVLLKKDIIVLFDYKRRNPLDYQAAYYKIEKEEESIDGKTNDSERTRTGSRDSCAFR